MEIPRNTQSSNLRVMDSIAALTIASNQAGKVRMCGLVGALKDIRNGPKTRLEKEDGESAKAQIEAISIRVKTQFSSACKTKMRLVAKLKKEVEMRAEQQGNWPVAVDLVGPAFDDSDGVAKRKASNIQRYVGRVPKGGRASLDGQSALKTLTKARS